MRKNVWIWNHYATNTYFDKGGRHYNFAKYLKKAGYEPVVFGSNAKHGKPETFYSNIRLWQEHMAEEIGVPFVFVRSRTYGDNGKQRVLNMIDFYRNVKKTAKEYAALHGKPDVIYASSVHPLTLVAGIQVAKHFGVKCICEVRDLWPESIVAFSSRFTKSNPLIRLLYRGEKWIYEKADALIFTMEGAYDYIVDQGWEKDIPRSKVHYINNGVDLEKFLYNQEHYQVSDADLRNPEQFNVVYTGSIRRVDHLGMLLDAAKLVTNPRIRFLIWGDGNERGAMERRVQEEQISNVVFKGLVEKKYIPNIVMQSDVNLAHLEGKSLFRYGISVNKLFEYLAAEKPILFDLFASYNPVERFQAGIVLQQQTPKTIAAAVDAMSHMSPAEIDGFCKGAKAGAEAYSFSSLTNMLIDVIEGV